VALSETALSAIGRDLEGPDGRKIRVATVLGDIVGKKYEKDILGSRCHDTYAF
jgi:hypothetical protein